MVQLSWFEFPAGAKSRLPRHAKGGDAGSGNARKMKCLKSRYAALFLVTIINLSTDTVVSDTRVGLNLLRLYSVGIPRQFW